MQNASQQSKMSIKCSSCNSNSDDDNDDDDDGNKML